MGNQNATMYTHAFSSSGNNYESSTWLCVDENCLDEMTEVIVTSCDDVKIQETSPLPVIPQSCSRDQSFFITSNQARFLDSKKRVAIHKPSPRYDRNDIVTTRPSKKNKKQRSQAYAERMARLQLPQLEDLEERQRQRFTKALCSVINRTVRQQKKQRTKCTKRRRNTSILEIEI